MPVEKEYDAATREAATARVLQRLATKPDDRNVFTVVADEFGVDQGSLRAWVAAASPELQKPLRRSRRPRFSPVVTTQAEGAEVRTARVHAEPTESPAVAEPSGIRPSLSSDVERAAALEAEVDTLRRGNDALKDAMRVLLVDTV